LILAELKRSREALDVAIAYVESEGVESKLSSRMRYIRVGEGRAVAILSSLRDSGGVMLQRDFEDVCLRYNRTLVGAGGFIARGSIERNEISGGGVEYSLTEKGVETVRKWESRYGGEWIDALESPQVLGDRHTHDQQKTRLVT